MWRCLNCMKEYDEQYGACCPYCGYVEDAEQEGGLCLKAGSILQRRYIVGTVSHERDIDIFYHGWDALFDRKVEIQEYFPRRIAGRSDEGEVGACGAAQEAYGRGLELFCRNSRELIRLYKEKHAATYHACFRENGTAYAVLGDCGPETVRSLLETRGPLCVSAEDALRVTEIVLDTLDKCHQLGVVHGMVDAGSLRIPDGSMDGIVLSDFGAWRYVGGEPGAAGCGSPDPEIDVYGAAGLLYELVTGTPWSGKETGGEQVSALAALGGQAREALTRALNHEFRTVREFCTALNGRVEPQTVQPAECPEAQRAKRAFRSVPRWVYLAAAGCGLLFACMGIWMAFG